MNNKSLFLGVMALAAFATATCSAQEIAERIDISAFGGWTHPNTADRNMGTNGNDLVPVCCTSRIYFTDTEVLLDLHFYCEELEGDQTRFEGNRTITLLTAARKKRFTGIRFGNGSAGLSPVYTFHSISKGENHYYRSFRTPIAGTYWDKLIYRIDSSSDNDAPYVGVSGTVVFKVTTVDR